jgi:hypothetical protein
VAMVVLLFLGMGMVDRIKKDFQVDVCASTLTFHHKFCGHPSTQQLSIFAHKTPKFSLGHRGNFKS